MVFPAPGSREPPRVSRRRTSLGIMTASAMDRSSIETETRPSELLVEDRLMASCAAAAAVLCFAPWYSMRPGRMAGELARAIEGVQLDTDANAFDFTEGVLAFLLAAATAAVVPLERVLAIPPSSHLRATLPLVTAAGATVCMLLFLGGGPRSVHTPAMEAGRTVWFYLALAASGAATWFAWRRARRV